MMQIRNLKLARVSLILVVMALMLVSASAFAQGPGRGGPHGGGPGHGPGWMGADDGGLPPMMVERLGLSEDQQAAIEEIHSQARQGNLELRKEMMRLRNELQGEMLKDEPNEKAVLSLTEKIGEVRTDMQLNRAKARLAVRRQLTPEQRDMMLVIRGGIGGHGGPAGRHGPRAGFHGKGGPGGPGPHPDCNGFGSGRGRGFGNGIDD